MTPLDLSFPPSFSEFRPAQLEAIEFALTSEKRFTGIGAPPGVGKSAIAIALAKLLGGRTVILTATRGLQDQYISALAPTGLLDMRGRSNYPCWEGGTCEDGRLMACKEKLSCPYLNSFKAWNQNEICVTNYAFWLSARNNSTVHTLVCDEAGLADGWLSRALDFTIGEKECRDAGVVLRPIPGEGLAEWKALAVEHAIEEMANERAGELIEQAKDQRYGREKLLQHAKRMEDLATRAARLSLLNDTNWVCTREEGTDYGRIWRFECIWPGQYREKLFANIERVILMSATLRPKTLNLLGISRSECDFKEWPRQFPMANGPVIWLPTARVGHRMTAEDRSEWLGRINEISHWGSDRKGLIQTVSFVRAREIADSLAGNGFNLITNGAADPDSSTATQAYRKLIEAETGILISPSFSTGWDFKGRAAEWQILSKIAFPDSRSKVMQARCERDKTYPNYLAAQDLVQGSGRVVRSEDDRGMTFLIDDNWTWFKGAAEDFIPKWFKVRRETEMPTPLEKVR